MSIVGLFVNAGVGANVVRVFRIARAFRLLKKAKALNALFQTLVMSIPSLWNIGSLLFVMFFIFAVLGTCREPCCRRSCLLSPWLGAWVVLRVDVYPLVLPFPSRCKLLWGGSHQSGL
jgi:hypothetical protein